MAAVGIQPFIKVLDSNGAPIVGAKLHVYEVNTTTYRAIYSDADLTTPMTNPLAGSDASDASGDFPKFYMAAGEYKLRAVTSADVLIWQEDDLDTGLAAGSGALAISRGGTGATTAAAARANLDVPSNSELTALSDQIADFSGSLQNIISQPGGRLTPTTLTPVIATGVTAGTAVYYTPYTSSLCPIYDGAQYNLQAFAELTLTLVANHVASAIYDCFIINDSGTIRIVTGPAWNTATAGAGARGTGAGTTELTRLNGLLVNANAMATARNGSSTYAVAANQGTYVGSIFMDGTNGQISCLTAYGQSRKWSVWNAYNRVPIFLKAGDATASWNYASSATFRPANNAAANKLTVFQGLAEEAYSFEYSVRTNTDATANPLNGIGFNSTNTTSGFRGEGYINTHDNLKAQFVTVPSLGINDITALESSASGTTTFSGTEVGCLLVARWRG